MQPRGGADQDTMECVRALLAVGADDHAHRKRGAILVRPQRAQIVGDALRQHRHDAIGEIDRIAAVQRLAIERRALPHIMGDVGDGDTDDMAAGICGSGSGTAWTASSWSLASGGSMVTNGSWRHLRGPPAVTRVFHLGLVQQRARGRIREVESRGSRSGFRRRLVLRARREPLDDRASQRARSGPASAT